MKSLKNSILILLVFVTMMAHAQFPPPAGQIGSTAIHADSLIFTDWASQCSVDRGYFDISDTTLGLVYFGEDNYGTGKADNAVVSLGDGGVATLRFITPVANGDGYDFAVFENSFSDDFLELGHVEVSSNGIDFFRFESTSLTSTDEQVATFGTVDATMINNLAGKYSALWGTPFDLQELSDITELNIDSITVIRIIDAVGSIDSEYATYDFHGNIINDPWPTPFETSGFDLDAVGVINNRNNTSVDETNTTVVRIFPNPAANIIRIQSLKPVSNVIITNLCGERVYEGHSSVVNVSYLQSGLYIITIVTDNNITTHKFLKQ